MNIKEAIPFKGLNFSMSKLLLISMIAAVSIGSVGCKSQKKLAREAAAKEAEAKAIQIEKAKAELNRLLDDNSGLSLEEKERILNRIKSMNLNDPEVNALIRQVENKLAEERAALEGNAGGAGNMEAEQRLNQYFDAIANAGSITAANRNINEALSLFSTPDALVLIIISKSGGQKDYDRPTSIKKYLEYLKDQKKNINAIDNIVYDSQGKIKELELIKQ
ncbi:MAG: hypothetical protein MI921_28815 [Cytophagales bacterium]|nr:hypothetical protein [Cytophagales bacterium]